MTILSHLRRQMHFFLLTLATALALPACTTAAHSESGLEAEPYSSAWTTYQDPMDTVVLERLSECFPGREVIGINCLPLISQHGSLHCITMQLPVGIYENRA